MFQHIFENKVNSIFEEGLFPKLSRYMLNDDPKWQSGHHVHKAETELLYVLKGKVTVSIDSNNYPAPQGSIIAVDRGSIHAVTADPKEPATTYAFGIYDYQIHGLEKTQIMFPGTCPVVTSVKYQDILNLIIDGIDRITTSRSGAADFLICNTLASVLTIIYYENLKNTAHEHDKLPKHLLIQSILKYLDNNYTQKITLQDLAARFRISVSYISHTFLKEYGISPINYIIERRITHAKWALTNTGLSLSEISFQVGYDNVDHFTKLFSSHVGFKPSEYRKRFSHAKSS